MSVIEKFKFAWSVKESRELLIMLFLSIFFALIPFVYHILKVMGKINTPLIMQALPYIGGGAAVVTILGFLGGTFYNVGRLITEFRYVKRDVKQHTVILREHSDILRAHTAILNEHSMLLNQHTRELKLIKKELKLINAKLAA